MNKYTVYTEFRHSKTVYLTFNLKQMIFQSLESEKSFSAQKRTKLVKNVFRTAKRRGTEGQKTAFLNYLVKIRFRNRPANGYKNLAFS